MTGIAAGGDDRADKLASLLTGATLQYVRSVGWDRSVFLFGGAFVEVGGVGVEAACHRNVQHCAGGAFAKKDVGGVGGHP
jgi:hypothetical protein